MGYLIDTNILSELQKGNRCHTGVQRWYADTDSNDLFLSVLVIGEIRQGIERLRRRDTIQSARLEQKLLAVETLMAGRILPITVAIADRWGRLNAPDPLPVVVLVPKLPLGNPVSKALALRAGKLELPVLNSQAGAWEPA